MLQIGQGSKHPWGWPLSVFLRCFLCFWYLFWTTLRYIWDISIVFLCAFFWNNYSCVKKNYQIVLLAWLYSDQESHYPYFKACLLVSIWFDESIGATNHLLHSNVFGLQLWLRWSLCLIWFVYYIMSISMTYLRKFGIAHS